jgi:hypothetical protein
MASFPQASPPTPCAHLYPPTYALTRALSIQKVTATSQSAFLGINPVSSVNNGMYFLTLPLVSVMRFIYTSKGMSKKSGVHAIYRKIRYLSCFHSHSCILIPILSQIDITRTFNKVVLSAIKADFHSVHLRVIRPLVLKVYMRLSGFTQVDQSTQKFQTSYVINSPKSTVIATCTPSFILKTPVSCPHNRNMYLLFYSLLCD